MIRLLFLCWAEDAEDMLLLMVVADKRCYSGVKQLWMCINILWFICTGTLHINIWVADGSFETLMTNAPSSPRVFLINTDGTSHWEWFITFSLWPKMSFFHKKFHPFIRAHCLLPESPALDIERPQEVDFPITVTVALEALVRLFDDVSSWQCNMISFFTKISALVLTLFS